MARISNIGSEVNSLSRFQSYVSSVENMATKALNSQSEQERELIISDLLDGQAGAKLRETIPLNVRRKEGAFFSSSRLRSAAIVGWHDKNASPFSVLDPAVGAGDLLIEVAQHLPIEKNLAQTLDQWSRLLHGRDIEPTFVRLTKARLALLAASRVSTGRGTTNTNTDDIFPEIRVGDGLELLSKGWSGEHILMNPPYIYRSVAKGTAWASGRTNLAALFLYNAVYYAQPGTRVTAILPDVIRTGSRYSRLRSIVATHLHSPVIESYGQFDEWTDIDVFILRGIVGDTPSEIDNVEWWNPTAGRKLGDAFNVHVGPVVPHRDIDSGPLQPYLYARAVPQEGEFDISKAEQRGYKKRSFEPPFVIVRRTSRPGERLRGSGTVIVGKGEVQIENHLLVLEPKDGSLDSCYRVIDLLNTAHAKQWLDERIRCRHLTVHAINEMPWFDS